MTDFKKTSSLLHTSFKNPNCEIFFGTKNLSLNHLSNHNVIFNHQIHSNRHHKLNQPVCGGPQSLLIEADGVTTKIKNQPIGLYTADCIPCFIYSNHQISALHLGWKGIYYGLLTEVIKDLSPSSPKTIFIGPHIQKESFEVQKDLLNKFKKLWPAPSAYVEKNNQSFICLKSILSFQTSNFKNIKLHFLDHDTYTNQNYFSYRREEKTLSRNLSYAILK